MEAGSSVEPNSSLPNANDLDESARGAGVPDSLLAAFSGADESRTYRLLADLLSSLAERSRVGTDGRASAEQFKELSRRFQAAQKDKADLEFRLQTVTADLRDREERLNLELTRVKDLESRLKEQQSRAQTVERERTDLESQLVARNTELHAAARDKESLLRKVQLSSSAEEERKRIQALEQDNMQLRGRLADAQAEMEQLRTDKNARISHLEEEVRGLQAPAVGGDQAALAPLWDRLAAARLAPGGVAPTAQAAQRLVEAFVDLATFVINLDETLCTRIKELPWRGKEVKMYWQGYATGEAFQKMLQKLLDPASGANVSGVFKVKLKYCGKWTNAALIGSCGALKSLETVLRERLLEFNRGRGNRATIADFLNTSGHAEFENHMAEFYNERVKEFISTGA